jgi:hypothetical protein
MPPPFSGSSRYLFHAGFLIGLAFDSEDKGTIAVRTSDPQRMQLRSIVY